MKKCPECNEILGQFDLKCPKCGCDPDKPSLRIGKISGPSDDKSRVSISSGINKINVSLKDDSMNLKIAKLDKIDIKPQSLSLISKPEKLSVGSLGSGLSSMLSKSGGLKLDGKLGSLSSLLDKTASGGFNGVTNDVQKSVLNLHLDKIIDYINQARYSEGKSECDKALKLSKDAVLIYFLKFICCVLAGSIPDAKNTLDTAKINCSSKDRDIIDMLYGFITAPKEDPAISKAIDAMKSKDWKTASACWLKYLSSHSTDPHANYYLAICLFNDAMDELQRYKRISDPKVFKLIKLSLENAKSHSTDYELTKQINEMLDVLTTQIPSELLW